MSFSPDRIIQALTAGAIQYLLFKNKLLNTSCSRNMAFIVPLDQKSMARANILIDRSFLRKKFPAKITRSIPSLMAHILAMDPMLLVIIMSVAQARSSFFTLARFSGSIMEPKLSQ